MVSCLASSHSKAVTVAVIVTVSTCPPFLAAESLSSACDLLEPPKLCFHAFALSICYPDFEQIQFFFIYFFTVRMLICIYLRWVFFPLICFESSKFFEISSKKLNKCVFKINISFKMSLMTKWISFVPIG